jgi:hypothetical protein
LLPRLAILTIVGIAVMTSPAKPRLVAIMPVLATCSFYRFSFLWGWLAAVGVGYALQGGTIPEITWARRTARVLYGLQLLVLFGLALFVGWLGMLRLEAHPSVSVFWPHVKPLLIGSFLLLVIVRCWGLRQLVRQDLVFSRRVSIALLLELLVTWTAIRPTERPVGGYYPETPELAFLRGHVDPNYRTLELLPAGQNPNPVIPFDRPLFSLFLDVQAYQGLYTANVYESLIPRHLSAVFGDIGAFDDRRKFFPRATNAVMITSDQESGLLDALGVKYLITMQELPSSPGYELRLRGRSFFVYERAHPLPRSYFVARAERLPEDAVHGRLQEIGRNHTDCPLRRSVLLAGETPSGPVKAGDASSFVAAEVVSDRDEVVDVHVNAPSDGYLVLADTHFPGWKATVDGVATPIEMANGFARAVPVGRGSHEVRFSYEPLSYQAGLGLTIGSLFVTLAGLGFAHWRFLMRRRATVVPRPEEAALARPRTAA